MKPIKRPRTNIVEVKLRHRARIFSAESKSPSLKKGEFVVLSNEEGNLFIGEVVNKPLRFRDKVKARLKVIRRANREDLIQMRKDIELEKKIREFFLERVAFRNLPMELVDVEKPFGERKAIIYFTADGRVDFRELLKDLLGKFHMRIELRQITTRQEASMLGGLGPCGRPICCATFLEEFTPVTIKMAKIQDIPINPEKISGLCGRLMCCLAYEHDFYESFKEDLPEVGEKVKTIYGEGKIVRYNLLRDTITVMLDSGTSMELKIEDILEKGEKKNEG